MNHSKLGRMCILEMFYAGHMCYTYSQFSLVYLPIKVPTFEQNNLKNTNTTKHIYKIIQLYVYIQCYVLGTLRHIMKGIKFLFPWSSNAHLRRQTCAGPIITYCFKWGRVPGPYSNPGHYSAIYGISHWNMAIRTGRQKPIFSWVSIFLFLIINGNTLCPRPPPHWFFSFLGPPITRSAVHGPQHQR